MEALEEKLMKEIKWCDGNLNNHIDALDEIIVSVHKREAKKDNFQ